MDTTLGADTREALSRDPYPVYRRLREEGACVWLDAANRYVVPRWEDGVGLDEVPGITAREEPSLMTRAMGRTMLRTDREEHARLRAPAHAPLRFRGFAERWGDMLTREAHDLLAPLRDRGHMDVPRDCAGPFAARTLKLLLGLHAARDEDLEFASQAFIDGVGNLRTTPTRGSGASAPTDSSTRRSAPAGTAQRTAPSCAGSSTPHALRGGGAREHQALHLRRDRRPHRLRQPRRAPLGGPGPLRRAPGDRRPPRVLPRIARLPRRGRRAPADHTRRAARVAGAARHSPRHDDVRYRGWVFRGSARPDVTWHRARPAVLAAGATPT